MTTKTTTTQATTTEYRGRHRVTGTAGQVTPAKIRSAYAVLAQPGTWLPLTELRAALPGTKAEQDQALVALLKINRTADVTDEFRRWLITPEMRAAALRYGGEDNHYLIIG
ncbi:hypothetical protein [Rhizomonospora bruguierae]|uniref:hypothetical protein n=1 Tax=Rhizomonospora bruguierae TaxID=1581705 RepID=UPI001BCD4E50|nr:hypothetical protein [Micromonospora sp. NBRC 107566]